MANMVFNTDVDHKELWKKVHHLRKGFLLEQLKEKSSNSCLSDARILGRFVLFLYELLTIFDLVFMDLLQTNLRNILALKEIWVSRLRWTVSLLRQGFKLHISYSYAPKELLILLG